MGQLHERAPLLSGKTALVTGASRGIGRSIAETFVAQGATVLACARDMKALERLSSENSGKIVPIELDLADVPQIRGIMARLLREKIAIDVLVNNAAMVSNEVLGMISIDKVRAMFEVNVFGLLELSQLVATRFMRRRRAGSIVNIASIVGVEGSRGQVAYSASKGAVIALTKSMAKELAPQGIRVNAVAPGMIATDRLNVTIREQYRDSIPPIGMGRLGRPEEIADACLYFASDLATYTTGQVLVVGGGNSTDVRGFFDIDYR